MQREIALHLRSTCQDHRFLCVIILAGQLSRLNRLQKCIQEQYFGNAGGHPSSRQQTVPANPSNAMQEHPPAGFANMMILLHVL
jgi:hypothetical protein